MPWIKRKIYVFTVFLWGVLMISVWLGGQPVKAQTPAPAPTAADAPTSMPTSTPEAASQTTEPPKEEDKDKDKEKEPPVEYNMYIGQKIGLSKPEKGELVVKEPAVAELTAAGELCAKGAGFTEVLLVEGDKTEVYCRVFVKANEVLSSMTFDEKSFPPYPLGQPGFSLQQEAWQNLNCKWSTLNKSVAKVDGKGFVTPVRVGKTQICVEVTDAYGGVYVFHIPVQIINPRFAETRLCLARGVQTELELLGCTQMPKQVTSSDTSVVDVLSVSEEGIEVEAYQKGKATIRGIFDGVKRTCKIIVTDPNINQKYGFYQKSKKIYLNLKGTNKKSKVIWSTSNKRVATVTKKGYVRTLKKGSAVITCEVDRKQIYYYLAVAGKTAVNAMRYGYSKVGKRQYSQARRMSKYYYDCSSFVYRCYRAAGKYLVRRTSWAPVAAEIGQYYERKGRYVKASGTYKFSKLRPGDLVCWGGSKAKRNGRYKRIYHISLYIGNGKTMESSSTFNNVVIRDRDPFKKVDVPVIARPC